MFVNTMFFRSIFTDLNPKRGQSTRKIIFFWSPWAYKVEFKFLFFFLGRRLTTPMFTDVQFKHETTTL